MKKILITGANGFVGKQLIPHLLQKGHKVVGAVRNKSVDFVEHANLSYQLIDDINKDTGWHDALSGVDVIVHLAARVHVMNDDAANPLKEFKRVNVDGSLNLARQAIELGVSRFIFISSIKVNGEYTQDIAFTNNDEPAPEDPYGESKHQAELALKECIHDSPMNLTILRLPLVYGPEMKGNLALLEKAIRKKLPLPLGLAKNKRDLLSIYNLCDFISICIKNQKPSNQTFLLADGESISSKTIANSIAKGIGKKAFLLPIPVFFMKILLNLLGKKALIDRLFGNLEIDIINTKQVLGWTPPYSVDESFRKMYAD